MTIQAKVTRREATELLDKTKVSMVATALDDFSSSDDVIEDDQDQECSEKNDISKCDRRMRKTARSFRRACRACDFKARLRKTCSVQNLRNHLPITIWLPKYRLEDLKGDLISGFTVALTVIPQSLAYAKIAELPPQYGLYSTFMAYFAYTVLGTSRDVSLGPTAVMSLLTAEFAHQIPALAALLAFVCGIIQFLMGLVSIGFLVDYISHPVINSFTTAAAITIACSQVKKWLGLTGVPRQFVMQAYWTLRKIPETKIWDFVLGLCCMILLYMFKRMRDIKWDDSSKSLSKKICQQFVGIASIARNAIVVIVMAGLAAVFLNHDLSPFSLTGNITSGIPPFRFPEFTISNGPNETVLSTTECFEKMGIGIIIVPLVGIIEIIAVGKAFGRKNGYTIVANQELLACGAANILGSFVSAYPVTASFSRSAVAAQSGVRTTMGNVFTGCLVLLALVVLTPIFYFIPDAALAAVIIMAVTDMVDFSMIMPIWRINKLDLIPWFTTFLVSLLMGFEYGILLGIVVSLVLLLHPWARPKIQTKDWTEDSDVKVTTVQNGHRGIIYVRIPLGLMFPGVEYLHEKIMSEAFKDGRARSAVIDFSKVFKVDYSAVLGIEHLIADFKRKNCTLVFVNAKSSVLKTIARAKLENFQSASSLEEGVKMINDSWQSLDDLMCVNVVQTDLVSTEQDINVHQPVGGSLPNLSNSNNTTSYIEQTPTVSNAKSESQLQD